MESEDLIREIAKHRHVLARLKGELDVAKENVKLAEKNLELALINCEVAASGQLRFELPHRA